MPLLVCEDNLPETKVELKTLQKKSMVCEDDSFPFLGIGIFSVTVNVSCRGLYFCWWVFFLKNPMPVKCDTIFLSENLQELGKGWNSKNHTFKHVGFQHSPKPQGFSTTRTV